MAKTATIIAACLFPVLIAGCGGSPGERVSADASAAMIEIGKRLGAKMSPADLERLASDESALLGALTAREREALASGYFRFRLDAPAVVTIAVPDGRAPFWLGEAGFRHVPETIGHPDGPFALWSRRAEAGVVTLGVNALDRRARGHYVVFVRDLDSHATISGLDAETWRTLRVDRETAPYADDSRPFDSLPAEYLGSTLLQPRRDWRDSTALVRGKVWKTRLPSTARPDQIVVSFGDDPAHSLAWTWRTDPSSASSVVRLTRLDGTPPRRIAGTVRTITSDGLLNDPAIFRHVVTADGLDPDTVYRYSVGDGTDSGWSPWFQARTGPDRDRDYAFLAMGDPQCGLEEWGKLLHSARLRRPDAGFLLIAGDLVDRGNERSNWDHFFLRGAGVFAGLPLMPCVGNHEYLDRGPEIFAGSFRLPAGGPAGVPHGLTYSFEYSDTFVAVLDSNPAVYSETMARTIADWLDRKLSETSARWKLVVFHHPIYPSHPTREQPQLGATWVPILDKHAVDLVLQGHDHAYLRTYPMRRGRPTSAAEAGTVYVVSVSGQKFVPVADRDYAARAFAGVATYQTIDVSPRRGTLQYRAYDIHGREMDRLELAKSRPQSIAARPARTVTVPPSATR